MPRLDGKVAIVTGAARGQGEAEARLFAREGAKVVLTDLLEDEGRAVAADIGPHAHFVRHDVTSEDDWARVIAETTGRFGRLDVLVNNAGITTFGPLESTTLDEFMRIVRINQVGVFLGMRSAIAPMTEAGGGSVVNISSIDGIHGMPYVTAYVASKFAVTGMTKSAALELATRDIRVNSVHPGGIDTPMVQIEGADAAGFMKRFTPLRRLGTPAEVANLVLFLASDESAYCTGAEFVIDGGWTAGHWIPPQGS